MTMCQNSEGAGMLVHAAPADLNGGPISYGPKPMSAPADLNGEAQVVTGLSPWITN